MVRAMSDDERMITHALHYALNEDSGEVHLVVVSRGSVRMSGEQCNVDDMARPLQLISDDEAWAAYRARPASWCGHCTAPPADIEGAPV